MMSKATLVEDLPGGWQRKTTPRSDGNRDVTLISPGEVKIRSRQSLLRFIAQEKVILDPSIINFEYTSEEDTTPKRSLNHRKFVKEVEELQKTLASEKKTLASEKKTLASEKKTLASEKKTLASEKKTKSPPPITKSVPKKVSPPLRTKNLSPKQRHYLRRQFLKMKEGRIQKNQSHFLANELNCPAEYIEECFGRYKEYISFHGQITEPKKAPPLLLKAPPAAAMEECRDPLEFDNEEEEMQCAFSSELEDFEVLNFEDEPSVIVS